MNIRITPTKDAVLGLLQRNIVKEQSLLGEEQSKLKKFSEPGHLYTGEDTGRLKGSIAMRLELVAAMEDQKTMLEAHSAPRVMVDIDL